MKTIKVTKTYRGCVELRDYDVESAVKAGRSITVVYDNQSMVLSPEQLEENILMISKPMKSRMSGGRDYRLFGYQWNPNS